MLTPVPAPQQPVISPLDWAGNPQQCPPWVGFPSLAGLPAGLTWSGRGDVPAIGARVHIYLNGFGPAQVMAYFHAEGYLGVICQPDTMPVRLQQHGVTLGHFFGRELEPYSPGPAAPALAAEVGAIEPVAFPLNQSNDWIPDYPPEEGDELVRANQHGAEHPETRPDAGLVLATGGPFQRS
ncbi:hypothetical protein [Hymenobacter sp. B81]|uniref:hypothetical protein n=1 Tax=Hymenobacter sp. B81 TaxID=3344878 RepID=UPI0037DC40FF